MDLIVVIFVLALAIAIFGSVNYYIGIRVWQFQFSHMPFMYKKFYWPVFWLLAVSFLLGRFELSFIPGFLRKIFNYTGSYWMAVMLYCAMLLPVIDLTRFILKRTVLSDSNIVKTNRLDIFSGIFLFAAISAILVYGTYQAQNVKITTYDIQIQKSSTSLNTLNAVFISDSHLGNIVNNSRLKGIVDKINALNPDIVFLGGDLIDDNIEPYIEQNMAETFKKINSRYGVYAVLGNHEHYGSKVDDILKNYEAGGIKVLRDEYVKIADSFYLAGRNDVGHGLNGESAERKPLKDILAGIDNSLPVIVLDHNPSRFSEACENNVDLQLSGHTHAGQTFPSTFMNNFIQEVNYGYKQKKNSHLIVSSGVATWGPPIRIGSISEIVDINIRFGK
jgi:hypothetical protein